MLSLNAFAVAALADLQQQLAEEGREVAVPGEQYELIEELVEHSAGYSRLVLWAIWPLIVRAEQ